ncbi:MAG TPA: hypothetical protein VHJ19_03685 [Gammaproteobacteria bacterium]|nr:hypothetical protein [Gammaproteobacteria bacterium]
MHDSSLVSGKPVGGTLWLLTSLSKISPQAFAGLGEFKSLAKAVAKEIKSKYPA